MRPVCSRRAAYDLDGLDCLDGLDDLDCLDGLDGLDCLELSRII